MVNTMEKETQVAVLIPAYNPDQKMSGLVEKLSQEYQYIIVVNDGCSKDYDAVFEGLKNNPAISGNVEILQHEVNRGKGRALKTGYEYIMNTYPDLQGVITVDADGQHTPEDVAKCVKEFLSNPAKAVFGCRDFSENSGIPARSLFGNRLTSRLMKFFCDIVLSDTQTGLRVVPMSAIPELLQVKGERYEYEMNAIFAMKENDLEWTEVPIEVIYIDDNQSSHFNPIKDSLRIYKVFLKFCLSSFGSALIDLLIFSLLSHNLAGVLGKYLIQGSTVIARICSGIFNFSINRWIFSSKKKQSKAVVSGPRYLVVWLVQMILSAELVNLGAGFIPISPTIIKMIIDTILFFISYKIQQKWVFHEK